MTTRQILRSSTIIVLGLFQFAPCILVFSSTIIACVLGIFYTCLLLWFLSSTIIGRRFFRMLWRENLRLERFLLGANSD